MAVTARNQTRIFATAPQDQNFEILQGFESNRFAFRIWTPRGRSLYSYISRQRSETGFVAPVPLRIAGSKCTVQWTSNTSKT